MKATPLLTLARLLGATLLVLMQLLWAAAALAQATGGSFGGGDFDDGGGGSYGGGSYGGESYGGSYDDDGGRGAGVLFDLVFIAFRIHPLFGLVVLGIGLVVLFSGAASRRRRHHADFVEGAGSYTPPPNLPTLAAPAPDTRAWMGADVTQIRIALEMSARPAFEQALAVLMRTADVRTKHGLLQIVHRVAQLLRENEPSWRLAGETNYHPMSPPQASGVFQQLSTTGRAIAGSATSASGDAAGLYFVTLLVAARREIVDFHAHRPEQIRMVLDDLMRLAERDLVAVEAYWLPHEPGLGLSEAELRRLHPDLKPVGEGLRVGTPEGMVFCTHCGQPGPKGSPTCGHCGAPRP